MTHPYSLLIWQPPQRHGDEGKWIEPVEVSTHAYALYVANLIHHDSQAVIQVVHDGKTIACFPDPETVERVERQV